MLFEHRCLAAEFIFLCVLTSMWRANQETVFILFRIFETPLCVSSSGSKYNTIALVFDMTTTKVQQYEWTNTIKLVKIILIQNSKIHNVCMHHLPISWKATHTKLSFF